jgi:hypothetical protein
MDNERNRFLHEKLKMPEPWHEMKENPPYLYNPAACPSICSCGERTDSRDIPHRNPDYFAKGQAEDIIARLVELGEFGNFVEFALRQRHWELRLSESGNIAWLIQQPRFATLLYDYFKGGE